MHIMCAHHPKKGAVCENGHIRDPLGYCKWHDQPGQARPDPFGHQYSNDNCWIQHNKNITEQIWEIWSFICKMWAWWQMCLNKLMRIHMRRMARAIHDVPKKKMGIRCLHCLLPPMLAACTRLKPHPWWWLIVIVCTAACRVNSTNPEHTHSLLRFWIWFWWLFIHSDGVDKNDMLMAYIAWIIHRDADTRHAGHKLWGDTMIAKHYQHVPSIWDVNFHLCFSFVFSVLCCFFFLPGHGNSESECRFN